MNKNEPLAKSVCCDHDSLSVELEDGRTVSAPLAWFPRLLHATPEQREICEIFGGGIGIHWPDIDEDISVEGLLLGIPSVESRQRARRA